MSQPPAVMALPGLLAQIDVDWGTGRIFWSVLGLAAAVIVLVAVALLVRRFMLGRDEPTRTPGFTLAEMRRLRDAGELSDEEYQRVRSALIGQVGGDTTSPATSEQEAQSHTATPDEGEQPPEKGSGTDTPEPPETPDAPDSEKST